MPRRSTAFAAALLAAVIVAHAARAASPQSGVASAGSTIVEWRGYAYGAPFVLANEMLALRGEPIICEVPACDTFVLDLVDHGDLEIEASSCDTYLAQVQVTLPDGSRRFADGEAESPRTLIELTGAPLGRYVVETLMGSPSQPSPSYIGHARLTVPEPPQTPVRTAARTSLKILTSTFRLTRRTARVAIRTTGAVDRVRATLQSGGKTLGRAGPMRVSGRALLALRLREAVRPHRRLTLEVTARGATGRLLRATALVRSGRVARAAATPAFTVDARC